MGLRSTTRVTAALVSALAACGPGEHSPPPEASTEVVVGIQEDPSIQGALGPLRLTTTVGSAAPHEQIIAVSDLPYAAHVTPGADLTADVSVRVEGFLPGWTPASTDPPMIVRSAQTHFVKNESALLRLVLQGSCLQGLRGLPGGPACTAPQTCVNGSCQSDVVPVQGLEKYAPGWPTDAPDVCKPLNAGAPVVQVGTGQTDYLPVTSGQTVQMEQGPQGGHHIWVAVRQQNLKQSGSTTTITSVIPTTGVAGPTTAYVFTFDPDEGNFCKIFGMRYQVDVDGADYHQFLGQPLDVTVTIHDASGTTGSGVMHINIDPQLLCPSGVSGCS